jgi:cysteinyl-tRNA synthetase
MGNYKRADEIRNWLKEKGVIIIDQKGAKGKARSTTWSYINP